jgi:glyoxylase-like metal-dependent hydrolase (beta-lactamase superfamily II)
MLELRFFNGGYCRQLLALIDRRSWRWVKFHAVFIAIRHPREGWVLIDTGYGGRFVAATQRWPYRLYRWATPAVMAGSTSETLRAANIDPVQIRHVVVTHFHADHIGGLAEFSHARIHYHHAALNPLQSLTPFKQVHAAFLPELAPNWLPDRSEPIAETDFGVASGLPFPQHDLFGDGLIRLVSLPGHAPGHLGVLLDDVNGPLLYATDAYWNLAQIKDGVDLIPPVRRVQWDGRAYENTVRQLRSVWQAGTHRLLACHAPETQTFVTANRSGV